MFNIEPLVDVCFAIETLTILCFKKLFHNKCPSEINTIVNSVFGEIPHILTKFKYNRPSLPYLCDVRHGIQLYPPGPRLHVEYVYLYPNERRLYNKALEKRNSEKTSIMKKAYNGEKELRKWTQIEKLRSKNFTKRYR